MIVLTSPKKFKNRYDISIEKSNIASNLDGMWP